LGCLGFGIGYDSATQVLAEDAFWHSSVPSMLVQIEGQLSTGITAKDLALALVGKIGARGAIGQCVEYTGSTVRALSMEARMTLCSMSVEAGGRLGVIAPDDTTFQYVAQRSLAPKGAMWDRALEYWKTLPTDDDAEFASVVSVDANSIPPMVTWGVSTDHVASIDGVVPDPTSVSDPSRRNEIINALAYMDILPGTKIEEIPIDEVFIGSCTNGRIEDLRAAASVLKGRKAKIPGLVTPGSTPVRKQAEAEGLDRIFLDAGLEWGSAGCSLCLGLYDHVVAPGRRCASSANRNFKGRQGQGSRTHLMSPSMVAAAAIEGKITDVRKLM
jgi:3-isopropylmalate/(R)-2-methylmalate dehydratase large subunit